MDRESSTQLDAEPDILDEVVMAVDTQSHGSVGCCYYVAALETLYFMEDAAFGGDDFVDNLLATIEPTIVLLPSRTDEDLLQKLDPDKSNRERSTTSESGRDGFALPYGLEIRPTVEFAYDAARSKLVNLGLNNEGPKVAYATASEEAGVDALRDEDELMGWEAQLLKLAGWIDVESRISVGCAGALLSYLQRRRAATFLPGDRAQQAMFRITTLKMFSPKDTLFINSDTLASLQIMQTEAHPHVQNQGPTSSGSKEALSVYGLFHFLARTPQGKVLLRQWFLRPTLDLNIISERHNAISTFLRPDNQIHLEELVKNLAHVRNVRTTLISLRKGVSGGTTRGGIRRGVWATLREFMYRTLKILDAFQEINGGSGLMICEKVRNCFEAETLQGLGRTLVNVIDYESSEEERRTIVNHGVDEELDTMKHVWAGIDSMLAEVARHIGAQVPSFLDVEINVVLFPQIGFLIAVPLDPETCIGRWEGQTESPWERMFNGDTTAYYKSGEMVELDEQFGDIHSIICDKEIEIIHQLAQDVLLYEGMLSQCSAVCAELDCLLALAQGARQHSYVQPTMTEENVIEITGGRHPLQELTVPSYVSNNTTIRGSGISEMPQHHSSPPLSSVPPCSDLGDGSQAGPNMLLMTGPNYSGKSVYLKQVALIVYMAHIGSFVPAEAAEIGLTDKILTRIATRESVSRTQSAFTIDLQQISTALSLATPRSLLLIDEFGKGTEAADGAGLAAGVFEYLLSLGDACPKVLGATHYHEIFEAGFLQKSRRLQFGHMDVRVADRAPATGEQVTYLYNFCEGRSVSSFGTCCAAANGIAADIVQRAEELVTLTLKGEDLVEACAVMPEEEATELQDAELVAREFLKAGGDAVRDPQRLLLDLLALSRGKEETHGSVVSAR